MVLTPLCCVVLLQQLIFTINLHPRDFGEILNDIIFCYWYYDPIILSHIHNLNLVRECCYVLTWICHNSTNPRRKRLSRLIWTSAFHTLWLHKLLIIRFNTFSNTRNYITYGIYNIIIDKNVFYISI